MLNFKRDRNPAHEARLKLQAVMSDLQDDMNVRLSNLQRTIRRAPDNLAEEVSRVFAYNNVLADGVNALKAVVTPYKRRSFSPTRHQHFLLSEVLTHRVRDHLIADEHGYERNIFVTAVEHHGVQIPTESFALPTIEQSAAGVATHPGHFSNLLERLTAQGHRLCAMWHSHPGDGRLATQPSARDLAHQKRMVAFGMPHVLGGIVSRDGEWFRLFNPAQDFSISLYGSGTIELVQDDPREKILKLSSKDVPNGPVRHSVLVA